MLSKIGSSVCEPIWIDFLQRNNVVLTQSSRISEVPGFPSSSSLLPWFFLLVTEPQYGAQAGQKLAAILCPHLHLLSTGIKVFPTMLFFFLLFQCWGWDQANGLLLSYTSSPASLFFFPPEFGIFGPWAMCLLTFAQFCMLLKCIKSINKHYIIFFSWAFYMNSLVLLTNVYWVLMFPHHLS